MSQQLTGWRRHLQWSVCDLAKREILTGDCMSRSTAIDVCATRPERLPQETTCGGRVLYQMVMSLRDMTI
jgi:hypothetical protein